jgi:tol-pal system protein YbgF
MSLRLKNSSIVRVATIATLIFSGSVAAQTNSNVQLLLEIQSLRQEVASLRNKVEVQENQIRQLQQASGLPVSGGSTSFPASNTSSLPSVASQAQVSVADAGVQTANTAIQANGGNDGLGEISAQSGFVTGSAQAPGSVQNQNTANGTSGVLDFPIQPQNGSQAAQTVQPNQTVNSTNAPGPINPSGSVATGPISQQDAILAQGDKGIKTSLSELELYNNGLAKLQSQNYKEASSIFSAQIQNYPNGAKTGDGYFWLAETFYILNDIDSAIKSYESLTLLFPDHRRVPKALEKLIGIYQEKQDTTSAKLTLNKLINLFPSSQEAKQARQTYSSLL